MDLAGLPVAHPEIPGYQLVKQIGSGGMATVFLAIQLSLDRRVAIKVLRTVAEDDPERTEKRFLREGRTLAKITHKNVCGIYDIAKVGDIAYIAMEYLDGGTLVDKLKNGVSVSESISTVVQIASALDEAHKLGIIHRDLKPANVMLRAGRVPVLTDFGIARELTSSHTRITAENMIVGTPIYMSPEQVSGGDVDGRSDLYALGVMFFELLTGQPPYRGDTPIAVCMQHLTAAIPLLPADLADLQPVMERMLAKRADERYADMAAFTHALRDVFVGSEALRYVLRFSPDMPWSEQLRDLGFSFDTLRDADVKAALEAQRKKQGPSPKKAKPQKPGATGRGATSAATHGGWGRKLIFAGLAVVLLAAVGLGLWWSQKPRVLTANDLQTLALLQNEFARRVNDDKLVEPKGDNALHFASAMRKIDPQSAYTTMAYSKWSQEMVKRADAALAANDLASFDGWVDALRKTLPDAPEVTVLAEKRAALTSAQATERALQARFSRLKELTEGATPGPGESVLRMYLDLRGPLNTDPEFVALEPRALAAARARVEAALASGEQLSALADARALVSVQPGDRGLVFLVNDLESKVAAAQKAAEEAARIANEKQRRGMLAIGAAPWATVESVIDSNGMRQPLPADASTPLLLTVPEGRYQISVSNEGGQRRQETVEVARGGLAKLQLRFDSYGADAYLQDMGW